ncbi:MAG: OsmC family protein [Solidesulfovibrio sp.]|uniref:OsmC family protein n=1 Tax=Solidesulfovibrio sp. TaxID=2910990 RepID=UPI002B2172EC|nr:OsmC family protein [Solidesulfovibrio sp.]MEA4857116.1 OsmC family protein [Solidesulfovibrio sp.]
MIVTAVPLNETALTLTSELHTAIADQSPGLGGEGLGPMPSELLLWSVAACFGQAIRYVAARRRQEVEALSLEVDGVKDAKAFCFGEIVIRVSAALPLQRLESIVLLAGKYCFVTNSLSTPVRVEVASALPADLPGR